MFGPMGGQPGWQRPVPAKAQRRMMTKGIKTGSYVLVKYAKRKFSSEEEEDIAEYEGTLVEKRMSSQDRESHVVLNDVLKLERGRIVGYEETKKVYDAYIEECREVEKREVPNKRAAEEAAAAAATASAQVTSPAGMMMPPMMMPSMMPGMMPGMMMPIMPMMPGMMPMMMPMMAMPGTTGGMPGMVGGMMTIGSPAPGLENSAGSSSAGDATEGASRSRRGSGESGARSRSRGRRKAV